MDRWIGRVAIVTGASSGIGASIARLLAERGMKVVGVARRDDKVKDLIKELGKVKGELHAVQCDVTKEEDVVRVVKWVRDNLGGADVLVNNAGVYRTTALTDVKTEDIRVILDTNVLGLCMFTREVIKDMKSRGVDDGHIFHINSVTGQRIVDFPGMYVYSGSKHAVTVLTEGLRRELSDLKSMIKITSISPGLVRTELTVDHGLIAPEPSEKIDHDKMVLAPVDVAEALFYALTTPPHVQVHEISINPTATFL